MTRKKQSITLVRFDRKFDAREIFDVAVAVFEPTTIHYSPFFTNRDAIQLVGHIWRPTQNTSAEDPMIP